MAVRELTVGDGEDLRALWISSGIRIRPGDDDDALDAFRQRDPGVFLVAEEGGRFFGKRARRVGRASRLAPSRGRRTGIAQARPRA